MWCRFGHTFHKACTDPFFDVVDRRYEKECPNTMILTSNTPTNNWDEFFTGDDTLLCTLDRLFDRASVFMMRGASFRGAELEIFSVSSNRRPRRSRPIAESRSTEAEDDCDRWRIGEVLLTGIGDLPLTSVWLFKPDSNSPSHPNRLHSHTPPGRRL
ncbi:ATP-binding protein [Adlercreutzia muris]|uniref:ATP-binding protein n=1 Tax=Adlercreutzia muris TaxID=1796610 RepID=UPI003515D7B2